MHKTKNRSLMVIHIQETLKYIKLNSKNSQSIYKQAL